MYNVGFGDSFLLFLPAPDNRPRKVLIDCGVHTASTNPPPIKEVVAQIVTDVTDADGVPRIDVVIATHRHRDHVYGFDNDVWNGVEVKEVWMPWTEHPQDKDARKIRDLQSTSASETHKAALHKLQLSLTAEQRRVIEQTAGIAMNNLVNKKAMATLHEGFSKKVAFARRRYLPEKEGGETFETGVLPGVKIHALAPSHELAAITANDIEDEMYLTSASNNLSTGLRLPFRDRWRMTPAQFNAANKHLGMGKRAMEEVKSAGEADDFAAAAKLEDSVNNTSLMLMFEIGKGYLFFPGDAQWGGWKKVLESAEWRELLAKTTFYKIGHHGSHNATPKTFVEKVLGKNFWALACTGPTKAWKDIIPRQPLLTKLREKSDTVVRSDRQDKPDPKTANFKRAAKNAYVEVELKV